MKYVLLSVAFGCVLIMAGCRKEKIVTEKTTKITFGDDIAFLKEHTEVIILSESSGKSRVAVLPVL